MKILLHTCCAPCAIKCIESLRSENFTPDIFWYNPNIHPFKEYESRRDTLTAYVKELGLQLISKDGYGLRDFITAVQNNFEQRCGICYEMRLKAAAEYAAQNGYESFTTTLLISPYQKHELLHETGERLGESCGVKFLYRDFRPLFREGQTAAREKGMYMQKYCGCIFSEEERYV